MFLDVFSMTDLCHQDHKGIIMNFINNAIISRSDFVKIVVALHFCEESGARLSLLWLLGETGGRRRGTSWS